MENKNNKGSAKEKAYLVLIVLLLGLSATLGYLLYEEKQQVKVVTQEQAETELAKEAVEQELNNMLAQYEEMETENEEMQAKIEEQKEKIKDLLKKAENNQWTIHKLRKETETLRDIMKGYVHTIDSLNTANQELMAQNKQVQQKLSKKEQEYSELNRMKDELAGKVKIGSQIEALDVIAVAQRVKRNGTMRETNRNHKAEKIKCCFTLNDNQIAKAGRKQLHLRIIDPNGRVLADKESEGNMFEFEGVKGLFSAVYDIIYDNEELDVCMYWEKASEELELPEGKYIVEVYIEDYKAGSTSFELY